MKLQFEILMFIICLNLATGLVVGLHLPGTEIGDRAVHPTEPTTSADEYASHFNATSLADSWHPDPISDFLGDVFSMLQLVFQNLHYILTGFPEFLNWMQDNYITNPTPEATLAFTAIKGAFYALFAITGFWFIADYISGRDTG